MQIRRLQLATQDRHALAEFYLHTLGLPGVLGKQDLTCTVGSSTLKFVEAGSHDPLRYHFACNIPPRQLSEAKRWLAKRVSLVKDASGAETFHLEHWDAEAIYFYDPGGNLVALIARRALSVPSVKPFGSAALLNISEIGIVTDDVSAAVQAIQAHTGSSPYRGAPDEDFTAIGDEQGLLLVVKRGRLWFPDQRLAAAPAPLRAEIETASGDRVWLALPV